MWRGITIGRDDNPTGAPSLWQRLEPPHSGAVRSSLCPPDRGSLALVAALNGLVSRIPVTGYYCSEALAERLAATSMGSLFGCGGR